MIMMTPASVNNQKRCLKGVRASGPEREGLPTKRRPSPGNPPSFLRKTPLNKVQTGTGVVFDMLGVLSLNYNLV